VYSKRFVFQFGVAAQFSKNDLRVILESRSNFQNYTSLMPKSTHPAPPPSSTSSKSVPSSSDGLNDAQKNAFEHEHVRWSVVCQRHPWLNQLSTNQAISDTLNAWNVYTYRSFIDSVYDDVSCRQRTSAFKTAEQSTNGGSVFKTASDARSCDENIRPRNLIHGVPDASDTNATANYQTKLQLYTSWVLGSSVLDRAESDMKKVILPLCTEIDVAAQFDQVVGEEQNDISSTERCDLCSSPMMTDKTLQLRSSDEGSNHFLLCSNPKCENSKQKNSQKV